MPNGLQPVYVCSDRSTSSSGFAGNIPGSQVIDDSNFGGSTQSVSDSIDELDAAIDTKVGVITTDTTYYVTTTGSDTSGDGSQTNPWASPHAALLYLSKWVIAGGVTVTISVAAGIYNFTTPIIFNNPYGGDIALVGAPLTAPITGIPIGDYFPNRITPVVPARAATEWFNTAGTMAANAAEGTVGSAGRLDKRIADWASNSALIDATWKTIFKFAGSHGILINRSCGRIANIAVVGDWPVPPTVPTSVFRGIMLKSEVSGVKEAVGASVMLDQIVCANWGDTGIGASGGGIVAGRGNIHVLNCLNGISVSRNAAVMLVGALNVAQGCKLAGVALNNCASADLRNLKTTGNGTSGASGNIACAIQATAVVASGNGQFGVDFLASTGNGGVTATGNGLDGLSVRFGSTYQGDTPTSVVGNAGQGINAQGSTVFFYSTLRAENNGGIALLAQQSSTILAQPAGSMTITNNGGGGGGAVGQPHVRAVTHSYVSIDALAGLTFSPLHNAAVTTTGSFLGNFTT